MRKLVVLLSFVALGLVAQYAPEPDSRTWMNQGVQAFKNAKYGEAVAAFQKAAELNPGDVTPRLYLAAAYMQQYIPGATSQENEAFASKAEAEFERVLAMDATNKVALASLGSLSLNQRKWDQAGECYRRVIGVDPNNRDAYYSLGFIAWSEWYPAYGAARAQMGLRPEDPGPLPEGAAKQDLRNRFVPVIEDGLANLRRALEIDPKYDDAMAYMNLLIRERADLRGTAEEYRRDVAEADEWVNKALETKREKASAAAAHSTPSYVRSAKLNSRTPPVYPELARQTRIQGTVKLNVIILKDGSVGPIEVISGHPLLIPAALEAIRQWKYEPTLLNGQPIEVLTTVDVPFTLPQ